MLIVATAGHIDHGKTSLVRALTGVDTDRLPEERARGISIDLGFAYWEAAPGALVAFVDVPGHQRFIRNMLAGVAAIDFALLLVACDDGPMPQTVEHLQILSYLGVKNGVAVLSKGDAVTPARLDDVRAGVRRLLLGTSLESIPTLAVSARTGVGIAELKSLLATRARDSEEARAARLEQVRRARFAVDRVFNVRGAGTVVTGTVYDGQIACEDRISIAGRDGEPLRVRGIQVHGRQVRGVSSGERAAINLAGTGVLTLTRGDWLTHPRVAALVSLLDVSLSLLPGESAVRHAARARLYLGATEVGCRVLFAGRESLEAGSTARARLHMEGKVVAVNGDRFVLRDGAGTRTLGGGVVVDPSVTSRRHLLNDSEFVAVASGDPRAALQAMLEERPQRVVEAARFERIFNLGDEERDAAIAQCDAIVIGKDRPMIVARSRAEEVVSRASQLLREDERVAVPLPDLRESLTPEWTPDCLESLLRANAESLDISFASGSVALRSRRDTLRQADVAVWERIRPLIARAGVQPVELEDLARDARIAAGRLRAVLYARARAGEVFQLKPDKYLVRELVARLAASAAATAAQSQQGRFTAAAYRDQIGTGRTLAIHILEMLDNIGITRRTGDERTILRNPQVVFGPVKPLASRSSAH